MTFNFTTGRKAHAKQYFLWWKGERYSESTFNYHIPATFYNYYGRMSRNLLILPLSDKTLISFKRTRLADPCAFSLME